MADIKTRLNLIISFILNNELFGIEVDSIQEIIKSQNVTSVPGAPSFIEGILNLRGMIVPVINLRKRFSIETEEDLLQKIIVVNIKGFITGIMVDDVKEVKNIENKELKMTKSVVAGIDAEYLKGILTFENNELITLIDLEKILNSDELEISSLSDLNIADSGQDFSSSASTVEIEEELIAQDLVVTFALGEESIAINLEKVIEIIDVPTITPVPDAPEYLLGVICQREQIIPIVDIKKIIDIEALQTEKYSEEDKSIVICNFFNVPIGLEVDKVYRILSIENDKILPLPDVFDMDFSKYFDGVYKFEHIDSLTTLLNIEELIPTSDQEQLMKMSQSEESKMDEIVDSNEQIMTTFRVGEDIYGVPIEKVREIINYSRVTSVPRAPDFIEGIINLRGQIIPVIDINKRFGLDATKKTEVSRIIVTQIGNNITGIIVDEVNEVRAFSEDLFSAPPTVIKGRKNTYIESVIRLDNNLMILILNVNDILSKLEKEKLDEFSSNES